MGKKTPIVLALQAQQHKVGVDIDDWMEVLPDTRTLAFWVVGWCDKRGVPFVPTRIVDKPIPGISETDSHKDRAFDLSVKAWTIDDIDDFLIDCNREHAKTIGAISKRDGVPRAAVYEFNRGEIPKNAIQYCKKNNAEPHIHCQTRQK